MFYRRKNNFKKKGRGKWWGGGGGRPRVKNPKSHNGTETNQLTIYKCDLGFTRVIQTLIR